MSFDDKPSGGKPLQDTSTGASRPGTNPTGGDSIDVDSEIKKREKKRLGQNPLDQTRLDQKHLDGERDTSTLKSAGGRFVPGSKTFIGLIAAIALIIGGFMVYKAYQAKKNPIIETTKATLRNIK